MTQAEIAARAIWTLIGFAGLIASIKFVLLPTLVDGTRLDAELLRRRLLILAQDGKVDPTSLAFDRFSRVLHAIAAYAEQLTFGRILLQTMLLEDRGDAINMALDTVPIEERAVLASLRIELDDILRRHLFRTSPLAWFLGALVTPIHLIFIATRALTGRRVWRAVFTVFIPEKSTKQAKATALTIDHSMLTHDAA